MRHFIAAPASSSSGLGFPYDGTRSSTNNIDDVCPENCSDCNEAITHYTHQGDEGRNAQPCGLSLHIVITADHACTCGGDDYHASMMMLITIRSSLLLCTLMAKATWC